MHIEPPDKPLSSFREFAKHYLLMVLSILTALGLEAWIEHAHHVHAAELSSRRMNEELSDVLQAVEESAQADQKSLSHLTSLDAMITADLKAGLDTAQINQHVLARKSDYRLSTSLPEIPTTAWDVAVADQSIGWIESDALQRYSAAYTAVRSLGDLLQHDAILPLDAPRLVETMSDLQMERPVEPYVLLRSLRQMEAVVGSMVSSLQATADAIRPALSGASAAVASAPAPGSVPQKGGGS